MDLILSPECITLYDLGLVFIYYCCCCFVCLLLLFFASLRVFRTSDLQNWTTNNYRLMIHSHQYYLFTYLIIS